LKKIYTAILVCFAVLCSSTLAYCDDSIMVEESEPLNLYQQYSQIMPYTVDEELPLLTLEDAIERALRNDTSFKTAAASLELAEYKYDLTTFSYTSSGENYSNLLSKLSQQTSIANSKISQAAKEESVAYSMKESYFSIIKAQRDIITAEESLKNSNIDYQAAQIQYTMGLLSKQELETAEATYAKAKQSLESKKQSLEMDYISLNILIGADVDNRYSFELPVGFEIMEEPINLEAYIKARINENPSIKQSENSYDLAIKEFQLSTSRSEQIGSYQQGQNTLASSEMNLNDKKDALYEQYLNLYNIIRQQEREYETSIKELTALKMEYESAKLGYENGTVSLKMFNKAKISAAEKETSVVNSLFSHMMNVEKFENPNLM